MSATGRNAGASAGRDGDLAKAVQVRPGGLAQFRERRGKLRGRAAGQDVRRLGAVAIENVERQVELAARCVQRQGAQEAGQRDGNPGVARRCRCVSRARVENPRRQLEQRRGGLARNRLRAPPMSPSDRRRDRTVAPRSEPISACDRQTETDHGVEQRGGDRVRPRVAGARALDRVVPPLQANLARHGIADRVAHPRHFDVEGIEPEQRAAALRRREQGRQEAILVGLADQLLAVGEGIRGGTRQSTAIRPAATRRRSPSSKL